MHKERQVLIFSILMLLLFLGLGYGYYYQYQQNLRLDTALGNLQDQLVTTKSDLENQVQGVNQQLQAALDEKTAALYTALEKSESLQSKKISGLTTNLVQLEEESKSKLGELESKILDINIKSESFTAIIETVIKGVVGVRTNKGVGSGVIVTEDGYVVTNYHVIEGISKLSVVTSSGKHYAAKIMSYSDTADIAVLKIVSNDTFFDLKFDDLEDLKVGQKVIALGSPFGLDFTVTEGIVSSLKRKNAYGYSVVQTDVPINPGNSGGPLISANGRIVGINSFKTQESEGIGFAMNPDTVEKLVEETIAHYAESKDT
ncbi:trypsin-like peptidase domain-containing protein [Candidatus Woesearchaeota archaeon]|nr:trypsin-like peptidase domain-containing protein [Candidatus Woesearchaeota archaeon]